MEWYRQPKAPTVLGHEVSGSVVAIGSGVEGVREGDRITATHHVPCLVCRYCLSGRETVCEMLRRTRFDPGGYAEYIRVPAVNVERGVLKLPEEVSDDTGSLLEPLGCALRGQRKAGVEAGQSMLIVGGGIAGCLHLLAARAHGVGPIFVSDIRDARRRFAADLGADEVLDARADVPGAVESALGHGVDRVIVCTGARGAIDQAVGSVDRGGTVLFFAPMRPDETYEVPFNEIFWRHDVTLTSSYGASLADLTLALELTSTRRINVDSLVTHRLPLGEIQKGFEMMLEGDESLKIVVDPRLDRA